jgi:hypothetical protein
MDNNGEPETYEEALAAVQQEIDNIRAEILRELERVVTQREKRPFWESPVWMAGVMAAIAAVVAAVMHGVLGG